MEKMRFHWEDKIGKTGSFTVEALTVKECVDTAYEEVAGEAEITDYYSI